ncbi:MAG: hypothetical protein ACK4K0_12195 [Flavobacteriales bacterium]
MKKKIALSLSFAFFALVVFAQSIPQNFYWKEKNKTYRVYPVRNSTIPYGLTKLSMSYSNKAGIVPVQQTLEDGEYIVFTELRGKKFKWYKLKHTYTKKDTLIPRAVFIMMNGKKNGKVEFYNNKGKLMLSGYYLEDLPHGTWTDYSGLTKYRRQMITCQYNKGKKEGIYVELNLAIGKNPIPRIQKMETYKDDKLHGVSSTYSNGKLLSTINYKDGKPIGNYYIYNYNGKLIETGTYADSIGQPVLSSIYHPDAFFEHHKFTYQKINYDNFGDRTLVLSDNLEYNKNLNSIIDINDYEAEQYAKDYHGQVIKYHENGKPRVILNYAYGYLCEEPVYLDKEGNPLHKVEQFKLNDTLIKTVVSGSGLLHKNSPAKTKSRFSYTLLNDELSEANHNYFDVSHRNKKKIIDTIEFRFKSFQYYDNLKHRDTLVERNVTTKNGEISYRKYYYLKTNATFDDSKTHYYFDKKSTTLKSQAILKKEETNSPYYAYTAWSKDGNLKATFEDKYHFISTDNKPVSHPYIFDNSALITYKNQPYTGTIEERIIQKNKKANVVKETKSGLVIYEYSRKYTRKRKSKKYKKNKEYSMNKRTLYEYKDGIRNGTTLNINGKDTLEHQHYVNGHKDGLIKEYRYKTLSDFEKKSKSAGKIKQRGVNLNKSYLYPKEISNYKEGKLHGLSTNFNYYFEKVYEVNYTDDKLEGEAKYYKDDKLAVSGTFKEGWYDGVWKGYNTANNQVLYSVTFRNDTTTGKYASFYENSMPQYEGNFDDKGYFTGTWFSYHPNGVLRCEETFEDSVFNSAVVSGRKNTIIPSDRLKKPDMNFALNISTLNRGHKGQFKFYFLSGAKSHEGRLSEHGQPEGVWVYYHDGGGKIYEVDHTPGEYAFMRLDGTVDTIHHMGVCKEWYANGNFKMEGLLLSSKTKFDCARQFEFPDHEIFYLRFIDYNKQTILEKGIGRVAQLNRNNALEYEGEVVNGLKQGVWRYYDLNGKLNRIGAFVDGEKDGRWLSGDLEFVHFEDLACINPFYLKQGENTISTNKRINITETFYNKGQFVLSTNYSQNLEKAEEKIPIKRKKHRIKHGHSVTF